MFNVYRKIIDNVLKNANLVFNTVKHVLDIYQKYTVCIRKSRHRKYNFSENVNYVFKNVHRVYKKCFR